jgi:hypothetical protein
MLMAAFDHVQSNDDDYMKHFRQRYYYLVRIINSNQRSHHSVAIEGRCHESRLFEGVI